MRQQFEEALPKDVYRLVRISRQYLATEQDPMHPAKMDFRTAYTRKTVSAIWEKQGYRNDAEVLNSLDGGLIREAEQSLPDEHEEKV